MSASSSLAQSAPVQVSDTIQITGETIQNHGTGLGATFQVIDITGVYDESLRVPSPEELRKK